jgi:hypothetical protein
VFSTIWTWIIPAALVYFAYVTWRPNRTIVLVNANHWGYRAFGIAGLTLGVGAMVFNDSGVSMPAAMLAVALPWSTYIAVDLESRRRRGHDIRLAPGVDGVGAEIAAESGGSDDANVTRLPRRNVR